MVKSSILDTLQSLIVAFVLAMVFRGFIIEGFVIPTGSMAPTLLGQHLRLRSTQTGAETAVGLDGGRPDQGRLRDHSVGRHEQLRPRKADLRPLSGDRVLVLKTVYPFFEPDRWDVVVFKNPTEPEGPAANFIKRLIGRPGESIWLVDGDVFVKAPGEDAFHIARKPDDVQRGVWQRVHDSTFSPTRPEALVRTQGPPWLTAPSGAWTHTDGVWVHGNATPATLTWDDRRIPLDDWVAYNMFSPVPTFPTSDLLIAATITPDAAGGSAEFELTARSHVMQATFTDADVRLAMWHVDTPEDRVELTAQTPGLRPGRASRLEIEHRDQQIIVRVNGNAVLTHAYDWSPRQRLVYSRGLTGTAMTDTQLVRHLPQAPQLQWQVQGAPMTVGAMTVDRDLFHRRDLIRSAGQKHAAPAGREDEIRPGQPAAATSPETILTLKDDQFFMLGDNSGRSNDGRLWGWPAPMVAELYDPDPFVVHRDLLIGKAFAVYFPASHGLTSGGTGFIPDFGRLRFIR